MDELIERCPWCDGESSVGGMIPWIECGSCGATGPAKSTNAEAIAEWNRVVAELRRVREAPVVVAGTPVGAVDTLMDLGYYHGTPVRLVPERGEVGE